MAATRSRGGQALSMLLYTTHTRGSVIACARCAQVQSRLYLLRPLLPQRPYSATAVDSEPASFSPIPISTSPSYLSSSASASSQIHSSSPTDAAVSETDNEHILPPVTISHPGYRVRAGLMLSRPPLLTREPTPFEAAFYLYQKRLNERLSPSFRKNIYFKRDTTPALDWSLQLRARKGVPARDIGFYQGGKGGHGTAGAFAWNDEITVDDPDAADLIDPGRLRERIVSDADMRVSEDGVPLADTDRIRVERPQPRHTPADGDPATGLNGDLSRLDRCLDRTLYLVVRAANGPWIFPTADVEAEENLHEAAARALQSAAGVNMNTWIVGRAPIAHTIQSYESKSSEDAEGEKIFFIKGRIMAGQADLRGNTQDLTEFKWLTKEELSQELPQDYYLSVKNAMPER